MTICERIYEIMRRKKMKQSLVAAAAGYDLKTFNNMLRGRRRITSDDIPGICRALEVTANDLFGFRPN